MATYENYVAAFAARCDALLAPADRRIAGRGVDGVLSPATGRLTMLVRDDRGYETLAQLLPAARVGVIIVCAEARRSMWLLAGLDADGIVRATSGARLTGADTTVIFVNTDHGWRRQGVGTAMTAAAIRAAHDLGATRACLNASRAGRSIYERLGFTAVAATMQFVRAGDGL